MDSFLPEMIRGFRGQHPGIKLVLNQAGTNDPLEDLRSGRIQVGFVRIFHHELKGVEAKIVWREPYVLALPRGHLLTKRPRIGLKHLKGQPMIMYPRNIQPALFDAIMEQCRRAGFTPVISQEAGFKHITTALVAAGLGVAIVPASSGALARKGVVFRPISDALPLVEIARVHRTGDDCPVQKRFLDFAG